MLRKKSPFILLSALLLIFGTIRGKAETHIITNHFELYDPDSIIIALGDTVLFQLDSFHNALEVNFSAWDSGFAISNGGFYIPFGGGIWIPDTAGTYYYVCELHAHDGMVGMIMVIDPSGIDVSSSEVQVSLYPNPVTDKIFIVINIGTLETHEWNFTLYSLSGKLLLQQTIQGNENAINLKEAKLSNGIYLAEISNKETRYCKKLVLDVN